MGFTYKKAAVDFVQNPQMDLDCRSFLAFLSAPRYNCRVIMGTMEGIALTTKPTYYKLNLYPSPHLIKAGNYRKENYVWNYAPKEDCTMCEISYLQEGSLVELRADGEHIYEPQTVHTMVHNRSYQQFSRDRVAQEFFLVFHVHKPPVPISVEEVAEYSPKLREAILPEYVSDIKVSEAIYNVIKSVIPIYRKKHMTRDLHLSAACFSCFAILTEYAVLQARQYLETSGPRISLTVSNACEYIHNNLEKALRVNEVAEAACDNYDHLSRLFRREIGMTMVEYINRAKIRRIEQLITIEGMTLIQAGASLSLNDPKYLSRLFHKYSGKTVKEFRQIHNARIRESELGNSQTGT